jgi:hypothetical protein
MKKKQKTCAGCKYFQHAEIKNGVQLDNFWSEYYYVEPKRCENYQFDYDDNRNYIKPHNPTDWC